MIAWLAASALAQDIELGVGRAAVLEPGVSVTAVTLSDSVVVEVVPLRSALVLLGRKAGVTTLTVEHARGKLEWTVTVQTTGELAPSGLLVAPPGEVLSLPVGEAAWCKVAGTRSTMFLDQDVGTVSPIGADRNLVQGDNPGTTDLVFETATGAKVLTLSVTEDGPAKVPASCRRPTETITLAVGEERVVPVGRTVVGVDVGHPDIVFGKHVPDASKSLKLIGLKPGTSILLVRSSDDEDPWARTVVVAQPQ
jgi:hypothetical protein